MNEGDMKGGPGAIKKSTSNKKLNRPPPPPCVIKKTKINR